MKIVDLCPKVVLPANTGSRVRIWNLLRHLSHEHEVRQFSQQRARSGWRERCGEVWVTPSYCELQYSHPAIRVIGNLAEAPRTTIPPLRGAGLTFARPARLHALFEWADVLMVEFPWQFAYAHRHRGGKPVVLATHNVEAERFASVARAERGLGARHPWARWIERVERRAVLAADLVLAVSEEDRSELVRRYGVGPDRVVVVENGVDTSTYFPVDARTRLEAKRRLGLPLRPTVLYTGSNTAPNRAGLRWVRRLAERAPHLSFVVVGEVSAGLSGEPFVAPGVVNEMAPFLQAADIAICPIEFGGGTKIKLLEALGAGLPTVAFEEAAQGLVVRDREQLRIVPKDEGSLVAALDELVADSALAEHLGLRAREYVCARHDWRRVADRLERLLGSLVVEQDEPAVPDTRMAPI
jgi:glycosyltransferase involved in cell wall biosynthesis